VVLIGFARFAAKAPRRRDAHLFVPCAERTAHRIAEAPVQEIGERLHAFLKEETELPGSAGRSGARSGIFAFAKGGTQPSSSRWIVMITKALAIIVSPRRNARAREGYYRRCPDVVLSWAICPTDSAFSRTGGDIKHVPIAGRFHAVSMRRRDLTAANHLLVGASDRNSVMRCALRTTPTCQAMIAR
jgi:hypothetical protein